MNWTWLSTTFLSFLVLLYFLSAPLLRLFGRTVGWYIRQSGRSRKELLIARAAVERTQHEEQGSAQASLDDEWERVDRIRSHSSGDVKPSNSGDERAWDGVIGFFHPFWCGVCP